MKIGLFFGSFNPVHNGHLIIANYLCQTTELDRVWFVVSPQNPFKKKETLLNQYDRLHLIRLAIEDNPKLAPCDIEFNLPQPSYTIDTLTHLKEKYPQHEFALIMGSDNLATLHKWKNYELIIANYPIYVYPRRSDTNNPFQNNANIRFLYFPLLDLSATFIRNSIKQGISMRYFLPDAVWKYLEGSSLYR